MRSQTLEYKLWPYLIMTTCTGTVGCYDCKARFQGDAETEGQLVSNKEDDEEKSDSDETKGEQR